MRSSHSAAHNKKADFGLGCLLVVAFRIQQSQSQQGRVMKSKKKITKFFSKFPRLVIIWPGYHVAKNAPKGKRKKKVQTGEFINSDI